MDLDYTIYRAIQIVGGIGLTLSIMGWYMIATASHSVELRELVNQSAFGFSPLTSANATFFVSCTMLVAASWRIRLMSVGE